MELNGENVKQNKSNQAQYDRLVYLLQEKPDIAQHYTKRPPEEVNLFWENIKEELNILGEPKRDVIGWRKVWSDYKTYIKKKLVLNKKEQTATGGGHYKQKSFNAIEESVIALINLKASAQGIGAQIFAEDENIAYMINTAFKKAEPNKNVPAVKRKKKKKL